MLLNFFLFLSLYLNHLLYMAIGNRTMASTSPFWIWQFPKLWWTNFINQCYLLSSWLLKQNIDKNHSRENQVWFLEFIISKWDRWCWWCTKKTSQIPSFIPICSTESKQSVSTQSVNTEHPIQVQSTCSCRNEWMDELWWMVEQIVV